MNDQEEKAVADGTSHRGEAGFTLIELMIATSVLASVCLAIGLALLSADQTDRHAQNWTAAYRAAQTTMEKVLARPYDNVPLQDGVLFDVLSTSPVLLNGGSITVNDIGATAEWGAVAGSAYEIIVTVPEWGVELTTVRGMY